MTITCKSCWHQEGSRCYLEPCERTTDGRSIKIAEEVCDSYLSKRHALETVIPGNKLVIMSERHI